MPLHFEEYHPEYHPADYLINHPMEEPEVPVDGFHAIDVDDLPF